jgi:pimeloyl-ACP methyl ester carboxylesterase
MARSTVENWNVECRAKDLEPPAVGRLGEIRASTLVVVGDLDMPGILEIADAVARNVGAAEVAVIEDAAHMVSMEKPEEFNRIVLDYLARTLPHRQAP